MRRIFGFVFAVLLTGCAISPFESFDIPPGTARDAVIARLGSPGNVVRLPEGGERLQYSLQPAGQAAWMVDLDADRKVVRTYQALTEKNFNRIVPGQWTRADVEREFGRPAWVDRVATWDGPIMNYRWQDAGSGDMFYWVYLDGQGVVRRAHPGMEYIRAPDFRR